MQSFRNLFPSTSRPQDIILVLSQLRASMYDRGSEVDGPMTSLRVEQRRRLTLAGVLQREGELLAAFDGLTDADEATTRCERLLRWLRSQHMAWFA